MIEGLTDRSYRRKGGSCVLGWKSTTGGLSERHGAEIRVGKMDPEVLFTTALLRKQ